MGTNWLLWVATGALGTALVVAWVLVRATRSREAATVRLLTSLELQIREALNADAWSFQRSHLPAGPADVGDLAVWDLRGEAPALMTATPAGFALKHERLLGEALASPEAVVRTVVAARQGARRHGLAAVVGRPGEPLLGLTFFRSRGFSPRELDWAAMFVRHVAETAESAMKRRQGALITELVEAVNDADAAEEVARAAVALLSRATGGLATVLLRYERGVFRSFAEGGDVPAAALRFLRAGFRAGVGVTWEVYRVGASRFVADYPAYPDSAAELVANGVRSIAVLPLAPRAGSRLILVLCSFRPRRWFSHEVELVESFRQVLRLILEQRLTEERLAAMVALERELVVTDLDRIADRLLGAAVRLVPGAEAGSLIVREGPVMRFAAVIGPQVGDWPDFEFTDDDALRWYGHGEEHFRLGRPRLAVAQGETSLMSVLNDHPVVRLAEERGSPLANLCLPVVDDGEVIAVLNLDALQDQHAFGRDAFEMVTAFQPLIAFVLRDAELRRRLALTATTDSLTGLPNRRAFDEQATRALKAAERYGTTLALLIMDMSGFKAINDAYGHRVGDMVLKDVAAALSAVPRGGDFVYRWGGDEFAALLRNVDADEAHRVARRFAEVVSQVESVDAPVRINVGVALYPHDAHVLGDLLEVADRRMYETKSAGPVGE